MDRWPQDFKLTFTKTGHVLAYALFAWLSGWLHLPVQRRWMVLYFLMAHAGITELIQQDYIPDRSGRLEDVALNYLGILLGILASWNWWNER